jgi:hypothetical protein
MLDDVQHLINILIMMKNKLYLLLLSFVVPGCTKIFMYSYGIRNPKIESPKSITEYLKKNGLKTESSYALKDTVTLNAFFKSNIGSPEIRFYDKNGYLMLYRDNKKCNAQNDSLIEFLDPKNVIRIDSSQNIYPYLNNLRSLNGEKVNIGEFQGYDFYLITYWAKWAGKVNKIKMVDWEKSLSVKTNLKIKSIKVTSDYMEFWNIKKKDMFKIYSPKTKASGKHNK